MIATGMEISWGWVVGALIVFGLTTGLAWLVAGKVTGADQCRQIKSLGDSIKTQTTNIAELTKTVTAHEQGMEKLRTERANCELRANQRFATREEVLQAIKDNKEGRREIFEKLDGVHERITNLGEQIAKGQT